MSYALIENGAVATYPYSYAAFRASNPDTSFPREVSNEWLAGYGIYPVAPVARPANTLTTNFVEGTPVLVGDVWTQVWDEVPASAEQIAERQTAADDVAAKDAIKADNFVTNFIAMTPAQVASYIQANVTDLASAKNVIGKLALMVLLLARREFR